MICTVCNQEFEGRSDAKFCSSKCKMKANRNRNVTDNVENVTDKSLNVTKLEINVTDEEVSIPVTVTDSLPKHGVETNYYHSEQYLNLIKHLENTSIEDLKKEGTFIPAWRYGSNKRPDMAKLTSKFNK